TDRGIERYGRLVREAEKLGIKVAFENVEGIEYLEKIIAELGSSPAIGYCWDTGHEMCYNGSMDVPALFGDKLICTHLNDNLGQTDPNVITWLDDSHLFPFDGIADWQGIAERLDRINYSGELTFELTLASKPGKNTHDIYKDLTLDSYFKLVYDKAVQFAQLLK
ncbi:MAG: sugar phosphate isomerase/epimerase, partial [Clostridia bacterium]|nr:sugar phosphate isomerase/epimerase [Clostridia bacterium]